MGLKTTIRKWLRGVTRSRTTNPAHASASSPIDIGPPALAAFIQKVDDLGGPAHPDALAYMAGVTYRTDVKVDQSLDPYGEEYFAQQIRVYKEISGREINQEDNELAAFDMEAHVAAPNAYNHPDPSALAMHLVRLAGVFRLANAPLGSSFLDMGCGWGVSSELAATLGYKVTAVDINPDFVSLVNRRALRLGLPVRAVRCNFDDFTSDERFGLVLFYECLHHALRPWTVLHNMQSLLAPDGKIALAGEPINDFWWKTWGIRQDALSVYCIRKFGWFESGWSLGFIRQCLDMAGLNTVVTADVDPVIGTRIVATKAAALPTEWLERNAQLTGFTREGAMLVGSGAPTIRFSNSYTAGRLTLHISNHRAKPVNCEVMLDHRTLERRALPPGTSEIVLDAVQPHSLIKLKCEAWSPHEESGNGDQRRLSFHLNHVNWEPTSNAHQQARCA